MSRVVPSVPAATRIPGLDLARAVVMIGMFAIHFNRVDAVPASESGTWRNWVGVEGAIASVSVGFVLIAGVALSLSAVRRTAGEVRRAQVTRAAVLFPLGMLLQELDVHGPAVILQNLAVLFLIAIPYLTRGDRTLLGSAVFFGLVGTLGFVIVSLAMPEVVVGGATRLVANPLITARDLLLLGTYPVIALMGPFLLGMWLGRQRDWLTSRRGGLVAAALTGVVVMTLASLAADAWLSSDLTTWRTITDADFEAKSPLWLLNAIGWQALMMILCFVVAEQWPRLTAPLVAMGRVALTVYVGHLLVIAIDPTTVRSTSLLGSAVLALVTTAVGAAFGVWWLHRHRRGPIEAFVENPFRLGHRR